MLNRKKTTIPAYMDPWFWVKIMVFVIFLLFLLFSDYIWFGNPFS